MSNERESPEPSNLGQAAYIIATPSLAVLEELEVDKLVEESDWHQTASPDFHGRTIIAGGYSLPDQTHVPRSLPASGEFSDSSSMPAGVATCTSSSMLAPRTPSLSVASTISEASASTTDLVFPLPLLNEDGILEDDLDQSSSNWPCIFRFLGCNKLCEDGHDWSTHCQSHFRGHLPSRVQCPFGCVRTVFEGANVDSTWKQLWIHVALYHHTGGALEYSPDAAMINHLWRHKIISNAQEKELKVNGYLSDQAPPYLQSGRSNRTRRRTDDRR